MSSRGEFFQLWEKSMNKFWIMVFLSLCTSRFLFAMDSQRELFNDVFVRHVLNQALTKLPAPVARVYRHLLI